MAGTILRHNQNPRKLKILYQLVVQKATLYMHKSQLSGFVFITSLTENISVDIFNTSNNDGKTLMLDWSSFLMRGSSP